MNERRTEKKINYLLCAMFLKVDEDTVVVGKVKVSFFFYMVFVPFVGSNVRRTTTS